MPARKLPDRDVLKEWFDAGMTYQAMADRWNAEAGTDASRIAFSAACGRYGFGRRNMQHTGTDLIPWSPILPEHRDMYDIGMLRKESARRQGKKFDPETEQKLNAWLQGLHDADAVIAYRPDTIEGWWRVKREFRDRDIVRVPEEIVKARKRAARKRATPAA